MMTSGILHFLENPSHHYTGGANNKISSTNNVKLRVLVPFCRDKKLILIFRLFLRCPKMGINLSSSHIKHLDELLCIIAHYLREKSLDCARQDDIKPGKSLISASTLCKILIWQ